MYGAIDFYRACKAEGVKPIIGCEVYVAPGRTRFDKQSTSLTPRARHLVLLCENEEGYRNLSYMVSKALTEGFYIKPRIDLELLRAHAKGLIALSACLAGEIPRRLRNGEYDNAKAYALDTLRDIWPGPLLSGASGPRHPRAGGRKPGLAAHPPGDGTCRWCAPTTRTTYEGGRRRPRRAAVHPDGQDRGRREPDALRAAELLPPQRRRRWRRFSPNTRARWKTRGRSRRCAIWSSPSASTTCRNSRCRRATTAR